MPLLGFLGKVPNRSDAALLQREMQRKAKFRVKREQRKAEKDRRRGTLSTCIEGASSGGNGANLHGYGVHGEGANLHGYGVHGDGASLHGDKEQSDGENPHGDGESLHGDGANFKPPWLWGQANA